LGCIYSLAILSFGVYGVFLAGWSSNSKYAFLGSLRAVAQMISYEIVLSVSIMPVILLSGSANFYDIVYMQKQTIWYVFPLFPISIIFFICILAETNRAPFDLAEAEAELVAGYNLEYSSIAFALFFLGEYSNMILMSALLVLFFFGGWLNFLPFYVKPEFLFALKIIFICFLFILVRSILPRFRYDQLMYLC
jgi:NADH:ubiquinone oxidoreductase subunit H